MAEIIKIKDLEMFNELYKFEVELNDHGETVIGYLYKKSQDPYFKPGDEVEYTLSDKGTLKLNKPGQKPFAPTTTGTAEIQYGTKLDRDIMIIRQSATKAACTFYAGRQVDSEEVIRLINLLEQNIIRGETDNG